MVRLHSYPGRFHGNGKAAIAIRIKKTVGLLLAVLVLVLSACAQGGQALDGEEITTAQASEEAPFPTGEISGVIQWGTGGGTDSLMRPLSALAEENLGVPIRLENKSGATGAVATQYVYEQPADGYTLLMGAENPLLYQMLEISPLTYDDFDCVLLVGDEKVGIIVGKDSPYATFTQLIDAALLDPGKISMATTSKGGMPWSVATFIQAVTGAEFYQIPFDSDASARIAVVGGHADFTACKLQEVGVASHRSGELRYLALLSTEREGFLPDVPTVTEEYPGFENFLPWGPFYGVFVRRGTPANVTAALGDAFQQAFEDPKYQRVLADMNIRSLGYRGEEAAQYLAEWQHNTENALRTAGVLNGDEEEVAAQEFLPR